MRVVLTLLMLTSAPAWAQKGKELESWGSFILLSFPELWVFLALVVLGWFFGRK